MNSVIFYEHLAVNWRKKKNDESITIYKMSDLLSKSMLSDAEKVELAHYQHILDEFYKQKAEGAFVRLRKRWMEEGEQNSSYFF